MFLSAARHGSFLNAGAELNISQGAVSQRIRQLELDLGLPLFKREPRGVSLTKAGRELATTVETSLEMIDKTASEIRNAGGKITLHVSPSIASKWLAPRLSNFSQANPNLKLTVEARADVLGRPFHQNEIAMRHGKTVRSAKGQQIQSLCELELIAVCTPELLGDGHQPTLAHILKLPLIQDTHRRWDKLIGQQGLPKVLEPLNFSSASLAIDAAVNMQGVAIVPSLFVERDIQEGRLREVWRETEPSGEHIFLIWTKQKVQFKGIEEVIRWIHAEFNLDASD